MNPESIERSQKLAETLDRWVAFTGVAVDQHKFMVSMGGAIGDLDVKHNYERIHRGMELDESSVLPYLSFRIFFDEYVKQMTVSAADMLDDTEREKSMAQIAELSAIRKVLTDPIFTKPVESIRGRIKQAAEHYECDVEAVQKALSDDEALEEALMTAFKGTEAMPEEWYSKGEYDKRCPRLCKTILTFKDDIQMISFAAQMPEPFIAMAVVYDEFNPLFSHFAFLCKSGENVWMLTDKTEWEHPAQEELISSRGGGERFWEHHKEFGWQFPYDLVEQLKQKDGSIISGQTLNKLDGLRLVWLIMVFERIQLKYFEGKYEPKKLMTVVSEEPIAITSAPTSDVKALAAVEGMKLLPNGSGDETVTTIQLQTGVPAPITRDEVKQDAVASDFEGGSTGQNRWLEERYEEQIPDVVFNPKQLTEGDRKLLGSGNDKSEEQKSWDVRMGKPQSKFPVMIRNLPDGVAVNSEAFTNVRGDIRDLRHAQVGDIAKFQKNARWCARYNKANMVQYLAWEEYERRKEGVRKWFKSTALKNREYIARWAARGELISTGVFGGGIVVSGSSRGKKTGDVVDGNIVRGPYYCKRKWPYYTLYSMHDTAWIVREPEYYECKCFCPITGSAATIFVFGRFDTAQAMAAGLGIDESELPDVLQNYSRQEIYSGNHLLSNVDPMDWCVEDPWALCHFMVAVGYSRRGYKKLRKEMGLDPIAVEDMEIGDTR